MSALANGDDQFTPDWTGFTITLDTTNEYRTESVADALGRVVYAKLPANPDPLNPGQINPNQRTEITTQYSRSGALRKVLMDGTEIVSNIGYNSRGQRLLIAYGSSRMSRYAYHPINGRLLRYRTEKFTLNYNSWSPDGSPLQDLTHRYDLAGNITTIVDELNGVGNDPTLTREFQYDAIYRLLSATGREHDHFTGGVDPYDQTHYSDNLTLTRSYTETYQYDKLGNIQQLHHAASGNSWTRNFIYAAPFTHNKVQSIESGGGNPLSNFQYDANGNQTQKGLDDFYFWNAADELSGYRKSNYSVQAYYLYAGGSRVKKLVRNQQGEYEVSIYLGAYERKYKIDSGANVVYDYSEVSVQDGGSRIYRKCTGTADPDDASPEEVWGLSDHLGSSTIEYDAFGYLKREEYTPFGETSFGSYSKRRYRFCGKELDAESGLYYYGLRYYAPWTCKFISVDPLGLKYPYYTPYQYAGNQPINFIDLDGAEPGKAPGMEAPGAETCQPDATRVGPEAGTVLPNWAESEFEGYPFDENLLDDIIIKGTPSTPEPALDPSWRSEPMETFDAADSTAAANYEQARSEIIRITRNYNNAMYIAKTPSRMVFGMLNSIWAGLQGGIINPIGYNITGDYETFGYVRNIVDVDTEEWGGVRRRMGTNYQQAVMDGVQPALTVTGFASMGGGGARSVATTESAATAGGASTAGGTPVANMPYSTWRNMIQSAGSTYRNGPLTNAGRALQKHPVAVVSENLTASQFNAAGINFVRQTLRNPVSVKSS
jgi:RHS repeat-associated protein